MSSSRSRRLTGKETGTGKGTSVALSGLPDWIRETPCSLSYDGGNRLGAAIHMVQTSVRSRLGGVSRRVVAMNMRSMLRCGRS